MKKLFILTMLFACSLVVQAQTFFKIDGVRYMIEDDHAVVARQDKELTGDINIPATVTYEDTEYNVTRLMNPGDGESGGGGAFQECAITGITLPESITEVPDNAFSECRQLSSVTFNGVVTRIGGYAFYGCEALTAIDLSDNVTEIGGAAFCETGLTQFKIPKGVTELKDWVFLNTRIIYIEIPATVNMLFGLFFATDKTDEHGEPLRRTVKMLQRDCRNITCALNAFGDLNTIDLLVPAGGKVVYQEYMPWMNMNSITEYGEDTGEPLIPDQRHVTIDNIRYMLKDGEAHVDIQPETLSGEISIPEQVTYDNTDYPVTTVMPSPDVDLLYSAFSNTQVTKVTLPATIKTIGWGAFSKSQHLQEVVLNEGITEMGEYAFSECPELTKINIPSTVTVLPTGIFKWSPNLKTLTLNEGLTSLADEALWGTEIETLEIPSTCTLYGGRSLLLPNLKTLIMKVKEPTDIKSSLYGAPTSTISNSVFGFYNYEYDGYADYEDVRAHFKNVDLIVPLGCAESYKMQEPWFNFRSITEEGSPYLKLNNSVFSAPEGAFTITNTENDGAPEFEEQEGEYEEVYTHGLCLKEGTTVSFSTTAENSQVHVYLFSNNGSTVKLDGTEMGEIGDDQSDTHSYRRYDMQVSAGEHTITNNTYESNEWPCMFLLQVKNISDDYYRPKEAVVIIDGITYVLNESVNEENEIVRTATIAQQNPNLLSGDIVIPEKVSYAKKVLQGDEWVTLETHDYDVTTLFSSIPIDSDGYDPGGGGAFQWCGITSISLPATITTIPASTFLNCKQLKNITLPEGITTIKEYAFRNCTSLEEIYLPETITYLSTGLFSNCTNLKKVNIPKQITSLSSEFFWNSGIETFIIPKNITSIGWACFAGTPLKSIKICHESYSDGSISFPEDIFGDISDVTLIVPEGTKETLYSQVYPWKNFDNIIEYSDQHDEHQYNNYRVEFEEEPEEETPASGRSRLKKTKAFDEPVTAGFTPSGVAPELPTEIEKNGKKYAVKYKESLAVMPASDVVLKVALTRIGAGDVNGDGTVDANDITEIVKYILHPWDGFNIGAADANDDGVVNIADIIYILNRN